MWYFEEGSVVLWRGWCGTLKRVVWYFEEGGVVLWRGWCGTLKRVVWYFEEGDMVLWRGFHNQYQLIYHIIFILVAQVEEILNFTQEDLVSDDIMMLDLRSEVYVWVGRESNAQEKEMAFKTALEYVSTGMLSYIKYVRDASHF